MLSNLSRRRFLLALGLLPLAHRTGAAALAPTPRQSLGPFYPVDFPANTDNDLLQVSGRTEMARGEPMMVRGQLCDLDGQPLPGAMIDIWQCDANGRYHHPGDHGHSPRDENFQGFGRTLTNASGAYEFRTIRPVPYPGRTPHIHFLIRAADGRQLISQMYLRDAPGNRWDILFRRLSSAARERLSVTPEMGADGRLAATFDIVLA